MASIFKIRRGAGTASPSLTDGELYVNYDSSLQYASGSTTFTLLPLNNQISGDIELDGNISITGDITASNALFNGTITIGDNTSDNVVFNADLSSSIIPETTNTYDLGSTSNVYRNVYSNNISGSSITGSFSGSIAGLNINSVNQFTASISTSVGLLQTTSSYLYTTFSTSVDSRLDAIEVSTASLSTWTGSTFTTFSTSVDSRLDAVQSYTASVSTSVGLLQATASYLNTTFSTSVDSRLDTLEGSSTLDDSRLDALETYSASLKTAIAVSGQDLIVYGNLAVQGTQTSLNVNEVFIEDKNMTLASGSTTSAAADGAGIHIAGANVTMSWDNTNSRMNLNKPLYVSGELSGSTLNGIGNVTSYSSSVNSRLVVVEAVSASAASALNSVSGAFATSQAAQDIKITSLETNILSASIFTTFSTSVDSRLDAVQLYTASVSTSVGLLQTTASYLNTTFSTSVDSRLDIVEATASLYLPFSTSVDARLDALENYTASVSTSVGLLEGSASYLSTTFSTSVDARLDSVEATASYLNTTFSSSVATILDDHEDRLSYIEGVAFGGLNLNDKFAAIEAVTASLIAWTGSFSTSVDSRFDALELFSSSLDATFATDAQLTSVSGAFATTIASLNNTYATDADLTALSSAIAVTDSAQDILITSLRNNILSASVFTTFSTSVDARLDTLEATSFSTSVDARLDLVEASASYLYTTFSTSVDSRIDALEGKDIIINLGGDLSGSAQSTDLGTITLNAYVTADSVALGTDTSGSYIHTVTGTANQVLVAGSGLEKADITLSLPQSIATTSDVTFNNITASAGIRAVGDIIAYYSSDERLKENIQPIQNALTKVEMISGNTYDWKEGYENIHPHSGKDVGVIAQEVEKVLPEVVINRENGFKAVDYEKIVPLLIEAIKELSAKVDRLENK